MPIRKGTRGTAAFALLGKRTDADEQPAVHSDYIHFEIIDYKDDLPVGNYEVTFDGQTEKLRKTKEGRYFGR